VRGCRGTSPGPAGLGRPHFSPARGPWITLRSALTAVGTAWNLRRPWWWNGPKPSGPLRLGGQPGGVGVMASERLAGQAELAEFRHSRTAGGLAVRPCGSRWRPSQLAVLALLRARANRVFSMDRLAEDRSGRAPARGVESPRCHTTSRTCASAGAGPGPGALRARSCDPVRGYLLAGGPAGLLERGAVPGRFTAGGRSLEAAGTARRRDACGRRWPVAGSVLARPADYAVTGRRLPGWRDFCGWPWPECPVEGDLRWACTTR